MSLSRRQVLAASVLSLAGCSSVPPTFSAPSATPSPSLSPSPSPDPLLRSKVLDALNHYLVPTKESPKHPTYAGAVVMAVLDGQTILHEAVGDAVRYGAGAVELAPAKRAPMRPDSIHDLASITKVYTAILVLQLVDRGLIALDAPVNSYLPEFAGKGKSAITVQMLLSHTGCLPVGAKSGGGWAGVLATPLLEGVAPATVFRYSSVGLMVLGKLVEKLTGQPLDRSVRTGITDPLGLRDTGFLPLKWLNGNERLVATDARTSRGLLRGVVHDDVANALGGIAGHAGIFATAADVAAIGQLLLNGGSHNGVRILSAEIVAKMTSNVNPGLPVVDQERPTRPSDHGLGVTMSQPWFMGRLATPDAFGHTGFTGTSLLVCPRRRLVLVLLTNHAHPNWSWSNPDPPRVAVADLLA